MISHQDYRRKLDDLFGQGPLPCPFEVGDLVMFTDVGSDYTSIKPGNVRKVLDTHHNGNRWLLKLHNGNSPVGTSNYPAHKFALYRKKEKPAMIHLAIKMFEGESFRDLMAALENDGFSHAEGRPFIVDISQTALKSKIASAIARDPGGHWVILSANSIGSPAPSVSYRSL